MCKFFPIGVLLIILPYGSWRLRCLIVFDGRFSLSFYQIGINYRDAVKETFKAWTV